MRWTRMRARKRSSAAAEILHRRYVGDDPARKAALEAARVHAEVARTIYELRTEAGMTQQELAKLIGTTQSVISRLEDEEYEGHSLEMLHRIATALNKKMTVVMTAEDPKADSLRCAFQQALRYLRRARGLTIEKLAQLTDVDRDELSAAECNAGYRPTPRTLHRLSQFYSIPERSLAVLAGAIREVPAKLEQSASAFAAQSESFAKLSREERAALDQFVRALREAS
jgi:transcriptional regulator with XRE-family HTH domain